MAAEPCPGDIEVRASAGSKRVHGPQLPPPLRTAPPHSLLQQELVGPRPSQKAHCWRSFSQFQLLRQWDCYVQYGSGQWWLPFFLRRRSAVREVLAAPASGLIIALADSGVCTAFDQGSGEPLCFLNVEADEIIRSLYLNQVQLGAVPSLITISVFSSDSFQGLKVRSTPLSNIRAGRPQAWCPLFATEVLCWPGFVELDDYSQLVVTCCAETRRYKVWDLRAPYQPRFHIDSHQVRDLKIANSAILLTMEVERPGELPLRVLDLVDGACAQELCLAADAQPGSEGWELVELFGQHLLTKAAGGPLRITDVVTGASRDVGATQFPAPEAFIHLPFNHSLLAFWEGQGAQLWSLQGERLATLEQATLPIGAGSNTVFVSNAQDLMFVYCQPGGISTVQSSGGGNGVAADDAGRRAGAGGREDTTHLGSIRVYDLLTGRQVAVVQPSAEQQVPPHPPTAGGSGGGTQVPPTGAATVAAALKQVTALYYDQPTHRLYIGTADGKVQAWGL